MSDQGTSSLHKLSSVFNELRLDGDFCDAVIKVEDVEFQIHKVMLCKCPYLRDLFRSAPDKKVFEIFGLSPDMMQLIIEFTYTNNVSVTEDNVQELLLAADQFNIVDIVETCCVFLEEHLRPENCIGVWQFTNMIFSEGLQHKSYSFITEHFEDVVSCEEFLQLSVQELTNILDRDDLNVRKESTVFEAILRWITHKREERTGHIAVLLSKVRLALMGAEYIRCVVMSNELVVNSAECRLVLEDAIQTTGCMATSRPSTSALSNTVARPRLPHVILLAIGGWSDSDPTNDIKAYDVRADCWINMRSSLESPRVYHGTVFLNGCVYCVGGCDRVDYFHSVLRLDLSIHTWQEVAPMYCSRSNVSVTVLDGCIYALGGYDGQILHSTAERYRPETNQWSFIAPMHEQRGDASCTTLHDKIYICGGFNANKFVQTCECYSPETDQWTMIAPMDTRRCGLSIIALADHVYAVGGFDDDTYLCSAEAYNPRTNTWHAVSSMLTPRCYFGIGVIDDQLFAVGGFDGFATTCKVEYYDVTTNRWSEACDMEIPRECLSCCVVSNELVVNSAECRLVLDDANQTTGFMATSRPSALSNTVARPRLPHAILLAIGGMSDSDLSNNTEAYDVNADCWINVRCSLEHHRTSHGTVFLNGCVYCVGGCDRVDYFHSVLRLDLSTHTWHEVAPMYCSRSNVSVTVLDGCIYALGGCDGQILHSTAERYRPETNQWSFIAPMHEQRSDASCTTLHNKVYICGGFNGNEFLQTCECYSPETDQWTMIAPMDSRRCGLGVIALADHVYAVGGDDDDTCLCSAEAYNPRTDTWHPVSSMLTPRSYFGIGVIDDQLFVVGGLTSFAMTCKVESYDATTDRWSEACDMEIPRYNLSCCVMSKIPNMSRYAAPRDTLPFLNLEDESVESGDAV